MRQRYTAGIEYLSLKYGVNLSGKHHAWPFSLVTALRHGTEMLSPPMIPTYDPSKNSICLSRGCFCLTTCDPTRFHVFGMRLGMKLCPSEKRNKVTAFAKAPRASDEGQKADKPLDVSGFYCYDILSSVRSENMCLLNTPRRRSAPTKSSGYGRSSRQLF